MKHIPMGRRNKLTALPEMGGERPAAVPASRAGVRTPAIDLFIDRGLHELYDRVLDEPVPDELRQLIEGHRAASETAAAAPGRERDVEPEEDPEK